ncbi:uncharacterized protein LOC133814800 [Humulus lupulus]|uniref:uncharacterized protein LOC133814800 n=1 Tax=Humulus lupulus TaxID=3486 RepID=UPI002B408C26|nr:uncharacterized protein LOC133814800 [Humulus lupulus]
MAVFEGFLKRVWGHLGIVQIARMTMSLTMVKFNDEATRDHVLENGIIHFDRKPVIVRPWTTDLSVVRLVRSVPLWIRLHDLGLQYWGSKCLSALVSTIGKPLMVDKFTKERSRIQFARVLVEMEITDEPPKHIQYINEHGQILEQGVEYEWLPVKCKTCAGFGHSMTDCRKEKVVNWVRKEPNVKKSDKSDETNELQNSMQIQEASHPVLETSSVQVTQVSAPSREISGEREGVQTDHNWITPKKVAVKAKEGQRQDGKTKEEVQKNKRNNKGINSKFKQSPVRDICNSSNIGICGLLETKLKDCKISNFMDMLPNWDYHNSTVTEGRLLIIWRRKFVSVTIIEESAQAVHCNDRQGGKLISALELEDSIRWLADVHFEPLKSVGSYFTWSNNQEGQARIYSKIDHVFNNEKWLDSFPQSTVFFNWESTSDHCSSCVKLQYSALLGPKMFRYFNFWAEHPEFRTKVLTSWKAPLKASGIKAIYFKLLRLKHGLKIFNRDRFGDIGASYQKAKEAYQDARMQAQAHPYDQCYQDKEKLAADLFSVQEKCYYSFIVQRSKITWLRQGDLNTSFFFASLKKRRTDNSIVSFINNEGRLVDNISEVMSHYVGHFRGVLGSASSASCKLNLQTIQMGPRLSFDQQVKLLKPFSKKEIREALFSIPITKSPGLDGYGSGFFKAVWQDIGEEISTTILQCFETGSFPHDLHETTLSLIPKVACSSKAVDYRPIACCSTLYKCMAKLLCKRLEVVLPDIIQTNQGAFVKGRTIAHNIMIFQDLIKNYGRASTSSRCAIKIDLSKVYDTVDWDFLEDLLNALSFPKKFISWVMTCVRSTSYSLVINGRIQGSQQAVHCVKAVLDNFTSVSGLSINSGKSQIFFGGVPNSERSKIAQDINHAEGSFPIKYLGVPMRPTKWKHSDCEVIIHKYRLKIQNWASMHLSFAGRIQLINSVLLGLRNYWMSIFVLPQSIIKEIEKLCRGFLWGSSGQRSKLHIPSWHKISLPKAYGGLGFRDGSLWNRSVLAKYIWAVSAKPDLLWVNWYWRKLCRIKIFFGSAAIISAGMQGKFRSGKLYNSQLVQEQVEYHRSVWIGSLHFRLAGVSGVVVGVLALADLAD